MSDDPRIWKVQHYVPPRKGHTGFWVHVDPYHKAIFRTMTLAEAVHALGKIIRESDNYRRQWRVFNTRTGEAIPGEILC